MSTPSTTPPNAPIRSIQLNCRVSPKTLEDLHIIQLFNPDWNKTICLARALAAYAEMCGDAKQIEAARREWRARQKDGQK